MSKVQRPDRCSQLVDITLHDFIDGKNITTEEDLMFDGVYI